MDTHADWSEITGDLKRMKTWEDDWDGEGAKAPHPPSVEAALMLSKIYQEANLQTADFVTVTPDGHITFEWSDEGAAMEASIYRVGQRTELAR